MSISVTKFRVFLFAGLVALSLTASSAEGVTADKAANPPKRVENVCDIMGTVTATKQIERSPWSDGTPSTLSIFETHIDVSIITRRPHRADAPADSPCLAALEKNEIRTYKLCSSTKPLKGSRITGTEGGATGSSQVARCLFDLRVVPEQQGSKN